MHGENGSAMNNTCNVRTCLLNIFFRLVRLSILLMNSFTKRSEVPLEIDRTPGLSSWSLLLILLLCFFFFSWWLPITAAKPLVLGRDQLAREQLTQGERRSTLQWYMYLSHTWQNFFFAGNQQYNWKSDTNFYSGNWFGFCWNHEIDNCMSWLTDWLTAQQKKM